MIGGTGPRYPIVRERPIFVADYATYRLEMPESAEILSIGWNPGTGEIVVRYLEIDERSIQPRRFWRVETGEAIACAEGTVLRYLGTIDARAFRYHVFEVCSEEPRVAS